MCNLRWPMVDGRSRSGFTLVEILVAIGVMAILGLALVGLMSAGVDAWRRGEADRQVHEKLQALRRQIADDLAAAVVDPPPVPDFHYALDTLWDLPSDTNDAYYIVQSGTVTTDDSPGTEARYFSSADSPTVELRIRVPFTIGAALLKARMDSKDADEPSTLRVARNVTGSEDAGDCTGTVPTGWAAPRAPAGAAR